MACYRPLIGYRLLLEKSESGNSVIVFKSSEVGNKPYELLSLPCSQCIGCRIDRSKQWALRCVHEASLYSYNCFITLTFNEENLNEFGTLVKADFQRFMKRLRKKFKGMEAVNGKYPIRYFHCGEYGAEMGRPHHHACLFNFDFDDKQLWKEVKGNKLYVSEDLQRLWPFGYCLIGEVTFQSAAYVARYITKKVTGDRAVEHYRRINKETGECYQLEPEYITMSRRPGIAKSWYEQYKEDVYPKDFVTVGGKKFKPPKYYDEIYDSEYPEEMKKVKIKRVAAKKERADDDSIVRSIVKLRVKEKNIVDIYERSYEK